MPHVTACHLILPGLAQQLSTAGPCPPGDGVQHRRAAVGLAFCTMSSWLDSPEGEGAFFSAIAQFRPVGVHRHAHLLAVLVRLRAVAGTALPELEQGGTAALWAKLRSYYDLGALEAIERQASVSDADALVHRKLRPALVRRAPTPPTPPPAGRTRRGGAAAARDAAALAACSTCDAQPSDGFDPLIYPQLLPVVHAAARATSGSPRDDGSASASDTSTSSPARKRRRFSSRPPSHKRRTSKSPAPGAGDRSSAAPDRERSSAALDDDDEEEARPSTRAATRAQTQASSAGSTGSKPRRSTRKT